MSVSYKDCPQDIKDAAAGIVSSFGSDAALLEGAIAAAILAATWAERKQCAIEAQIYALREFGSARHSQNIGNAIRNQWEAPMAKPTGPQLSALKWLINRNGDGLFEKNNSVLVAGGERAPIMRGTWNALAKLGLVEFYLHNKRCRVTDAGRAVKLGMVRESEGEEA